MECEAKMLVSLRLQRESGLPSSLNGLNQSYVTAKRLVCFIKGNVDLRDSLHSCRIGGELVWNGINEVLRVRYPGWLARVKHETMSRSDAVARADGIVPETVARRKLNLGAYPAESQFSRAIFDDEADVVVLSLQPDICTAMVRHRKEGFLFYPSESSSWSADDVQWLKSEFEPLGNLSVAEAMAHLAAVIERIRQRGDPRILIYNMSPVTPGEEIHCYQGLDEIFSTRIRRFNLGLIELSEATGISIIDVDTILARKGAEALKLDTLHLAPSAYRLLAEEVVRVLADLGTFDEA